MFSPRARHRRSWDLNRHQQSDPPLTLQPLLLFCSTQWWWSRLLCSCCCVFSRRHREMTVADWLIIVFWGFREAIAHPLFASLPLSHTSFLCCLSAGGSGAGDASLLSLGQGWSLDISILSCPLEIEHVDLYEWEKSVSWLHAERFKDKAQMMIGHWELTRSETRNCIFWPKHLQMQTAEMFLMSH